MDGDTAAAKIWEPFGTLYADPEARSMARVGVVDVGSNSVRLVVFDGAARSPAYFYNEKIMCALGAGLSESGSLSAEGRVRALRALKRFAALADGMGVSPLTAVATAAVRDADDGQDFVDEVKRETGIEIHVIPGDEEARLSAQGVLLGWPGSYGLVCDIGGSSMELADLADGNVGRRLTSPLGPLKLREVKGGDKGLDAFIKETISDLHDRMQSEVGMRLFLVGGSWRAIARIDMARRDYPLTVLHEYRMTPEAVAETRKYIEAQDADELRSRAGVSSDRMALVPLAIRVLERLVKVFEPKDIAISSYGIREGMLYERMPDAMRDRDPLLEACRFAEAKDSRLPGFGSMLYDFVSPLFPHADWQRKRIIEAACLLHDVSWRAHPDYRGEVCFDYATRANLGGLKHYERVFLGLALMHRYSSKKPDSRFHPLFSLLSEEDAKEAEVLGRAMRFGAMLWLGAQAPGALLWDAAARHLTLELEPRAQPLYGEVGESRFKALAGALNAEAEVTLRGR